MTTYESPGVGGLGPGRYVCTDPSRSELHPWPTTGRRSCKATAPAMAQAAASVPSSVARSGPTRVDTLGLADRLRCSRLPATRVDVHTNPKPLEREQPMTDENSDERLGVNDLIEAFGNRNRWRGAHPDPVSYTHLTLPTIYSV